MVAVGPRFVLLLLFISATLLFFTVVHYENRLSSLQTHLAFVEHHVASLSQSSAADQTLVIYNRVPKTGSTTLMGVAYNLCERLGYNIVHLNTSKNAHVMSFVDQMEFANNITAWKSRLPALYHGHIAFIDFTSLGVQHRPLYVNVIRRPLDRLVSHYYFLRYGDDFRPHLVRTRAGNTETFDDCVRLKHPDCQVNHMWLQVPFFCGTMAFCWQPGSRAALEQAKYNLAHHYLLVGTTERLSEFVTLLEALLPRMFSGAARELRDGGKSHLRRTQQKQEPSARTKEIIYGSDVWKVENEFYRFAEEQFNFVKRKTMSSAGGSLVPLSRAYHYEKLRPK